MAGGQVADALITRNAIDRGVGSEVNPLLGSNPSMERLLAEKAAITAPVAYGIAKLYPSHPKFALTLASLFGAAGVIPAIRNYNLGR